VGVIYSHEHLIARPPAPFDAETDLIVDSIPAASRELELFKQCGGGTLVDATPVDYGRNLAALVELSRATGINVIASTGRHKAIYAERYSPNVTVDELADEFVTELTRGVSGIRPGIIKVATSESRVAAIERVVLVAAGRASALTGVAVTTHMEAGRLGPEQVSVLREGGVDPSKVIVGHADRVIDADYHESILRQGVYLEFDQIGHLKHFPDEARAKAIVELWRRGYGARLCLSSDLGRRSHQRSYGGSPGLGHVLESFIPELIRHGLSPDEALSMVTTNPCRVLDIQS
jgi:phosphotriesterase-related protein